MKKYLLILAVWGILISSAFGQALYQDDFESYAVGDYIAVQNPTWWTTWSGLPGSVEDAVISSDYAQSGSMSLKVSGTNDAILKLGNKTSGKYMLTFSMYFPVGYGGYYNLQHYESPGIEWAYEVYFGANGSGYLSAGVAQVASFNFTNGTWIECQNIYNLDDDLAQLYIDGNLIYEWPLSWQATTQSGLLQVGSIDFFAGAPGTDSPLYYVDDLTWEEVPEALYSENFESYSVGDFIAVDNPTWWTTWSGLPGSGEDAVISSDYALSPSQSLKVTGTTDCILKLGDKTSGKYEVKFNYYVPAGYGGYYNFQHYENPGIEWAFEVYFAADGTGYISAGVEQIASFNYNQDEWIEMDNVIDLDADWAQVFVNGTLLYEWPFSWQYNTMSGTLQLGGIDFWAGAPGTDSPLYYNDDLQVIQLSGGSGSPTISLDPNSISENLMAGTTSTQPLAIDNVGQLDLTYDILVTYPGPGKKMSSSVPMTENKKVTLSNISADPNPEPGGSPTPSDEEILHYDGDNDNAIGFTNGGTMRVSANFTSDLVQDYIGMELTAIEIYINDLPISSKLQVYNYGLPDLPGPGDMLIEQDFNALATSWQTIDLDNPVVISGGDIWVGYWVDHSAGTFVAGIDAGPADPNGDWVSSGPGWQHLSDQGYPDNWNIRAHLTGTPIVQWLSVSPSSGTIAAGDSQDVDVNFDATGLDGGGYYAELVVNNNDPENPQMIVPVTLDVTVGINELDKNAVMIYPNPTIDNINVKADCKILSVELMNLMGQCIIRKDINAETAKVDASNLTQGVYMLKVETEKGVIARRISVN